MKRSMVGERKSGIRRLKRNRLSERMKQNVQLHLSQYVFVLVLFIMGLIFGAIIVNTLSPTQKKELIHYMGFFFQGLDQQTIADPKIAFQHSLGSHLKTLGLMWILGLSVIGIPFVLLLIFFKGLVIGFTVGFLVNQLSWQGLWFASLSIIPQNLLVVPAMMMLAVWSMQFASLLIKNRLIARRGTIYPQFLSYAMVAVVLVGVFLVASILEAYISPWLMRTAIPETVALYIWLI
ncbi:stage II sporulation protein M [Mechercharimyces sp. CAU 1602]|uniref:stage II sporulation protein M n=1 Tax=Mechercharimyces sp. CAU 1602 TaxID=2973933 RepID=UPI002161E8DD|nr:stage II sporulation protein M [Mechercharimyces sp. CAU 1602]MCS1350829.1 stage II sporulation protein M [Mechercharimyces sp. CAU 1602]